MNQTNLTNPQETQLIKDALVFSDESSDQFDPIKATSLLQEALMLGEGMAAYYLGVGYMNGVYGLDEQKAKSYFELAIDLDCSFGYFGLAKYYYEQGEHIEQALDLFDAGARLSNFECARRLYVIHLEGREVKTDIDYLMELMMPFVLTKQIEAIYYVGYLYALNNDEKAYDYLLQAGVSGLTKAWYDLSQLYYKKEKLQEALQYVIIGIAYANHVGDTMLLVYFDDLKMDLESQCDQSQRSQASLFVDHFFKVIEETTQIKIQP